MQDEWFKVKVLQDYSAEDEGASLRAWQAGNKNLSINILRSETNSVWVKMCRSKVNQGVILFRIHIVEEPRTAYLEWEIAAYKHRNIPIGGEQVHLINRLKVRDLAIPDGDLMIFDKKRAVVNKYNSHGYMTHETFYDETDNISQFLELRKMLIDRAKPLQI